MNNRRILAQLVSWSILVIFTLAGLGCTSTYSPTTNSPNHPASIEGEAGEMRVDAKIFEAPPSSLLGSALGNRTSHTEHELHAHHQPAQGLPSSVTSLLEDISNAGLDVSQAVEEADLEKTQNLAERIINALQKLEQVEVPDNPHIWHMHSAYINSAKQAAKKLKDMEDLQHGHHLSAALNGAVDQLKDALVSSSQSDGQKEQHSDHSGHGGHR